MRIRFTSPVKTESSVKKKTYCSTANHWVGQPNKPRKGLRELRRSVGERNCVEGKFGQAKRWYGRGNLHAKLQTTSESMIGAIVVVLNLIRLVQQHVQTFVRNIIHKVAVLLLDLVKRNFATF